MPNQSTATRFVTGIRISLLIGIVIAISGTAVLTARSFAQTESTPNVSTPVVDSPIALIPVYTVYTGVCDDKEQAVAKADELSKVGVNSTIVDLSDAECGVVVSQCVEYISARNVKALLAEMNMDALITVSDYNLHDPDTALITGKDEREQLLETLREMSMQTEDVKGIEDLENDLVSLDSENERMRLEIERLKQEREEVQNN